MTTVGAVGACLPAVATYRPAVLVLEELLSRGAIDPYFHGVLAGH